MQLTESKIRQIARRVLKELFTKKSGLNLTKFVDPDVGVDSYGDGGDGFDFGEAEEKLDEEEIEEESQS